MVLRYCIFFQILLVCAGGVHAQQQPDSSAVPDIYKKINDYSDKRKFTNMVVGLFIKPISTPSSKPVIKPRNQAQTGYATNEGKVIRHINIVTLDPFGYSIYDTTAKPRSFLEKTGNSLHIKTLHFTILNQLLIHKNDRFDSLLVKESERLVRSQSYIHDVVITTSPVGISSDSVDISIRVSDLWSIVPDGALSNERFTIALTEKNLAGLGHTFYNAYTQDYINGGNAYSTYYYIPNIKNTHINSRLIYAIDEDRNYHKSLNIERPFFSPITRWAGGIFVSQQKLPEWVHINDSIRLQLNSTYNIQDYWAGIAWQVFKGNSETERTTKLVLSGRLYSIIYLEKPSEQSEIPDYYCNEKFFMSELGISTRKYSRQYYIFRFGTPEDVPIGMASGIVGGYQLKNHERWYWGLRQSWGNIFKWGYLGSALEYGTFINASKPTEEVLTFSVNYFSRLITIGKWNFRQFLKPEISIGINQSPYDRLTLNDGYGLNGFNSDVLSGTRRFLVVIQTQSYAPWNLIGFRFGPYLNLSFGMLGDEASGFSKSRLYPQLGMGVLIKNDYLVISRIQLSFAFYPSIPGNGNNVFKVNPFRAADFGFPDFIIGKPEVIGFQ
jgi:hypothetical protein